LTRFCRITIDLALDQMYEIGAALGIPEQDHPPPPASGRIEVVVGPVVPPGLEYIGLAQSIAGASAEGWPDHQPKKRLLPIGRYEQATHRLEASRLGEDDGKLGVIGRGGIATDL
jgi:hypothetical protein